MELLHKDVLFGLNLLTLIGFVAMAAGLNLGRQGHSRAPLAFVLMGIGTALVVAGLWVGQPGG